MQSASQLQIVQRMIDAGESEANIAKVIQHFKTAGVPSTQGVQKPDRASGLATLGDFVIGALKGGGETALNLGALLHKIPGVSQAVDALYGDEGDGERNLEGLITGAQPRKGLSTRAFEVARANVQPTNTAQSIGKGTEQLAELIGAGGVVSGATRALPRLGARVAAEGIAGAGMSAAQGGNPVTGGVLSAVSPVVGKVVGAIPGRLKEQAGKQVMQALGPTKERFKAMASKVAPEVLKRGITGSREAMKEQAADMVAQLGPKIDEAISAYGARQTSTAPIIEALEASKAPFQVAVVGGKSPVAAAIRSGKTVPLDARALDQIDSLQKVITDIGDTATVEQLIGVRRAWDKIVSQAGGYQQRAAGAIGVPLADQSEAAIKRIGSTAIRKVLNAEVPELAAINKEYAFWKSLDDILGQTLSRTAPQSQGLGRKIAQGAGMAAGAFTGSGSGPMGAIVGAGMGATAAKMIDKAITSPAWALTSAKLKDRLADALISGKPARIAEATSRILAVQGSKVGR